MVDCALFAVQELMSRHKECLLYGQDVGGRLGGVFREAATLAEKFGASVEVVKDGQAVSALSIMGLMMLGAGKGAEIEIRAEGWDAKEALDALAELVAAGFHEQD